MNRNRFLILVGVAILLALAGGLFQFSRSKSWQESKSDRLVLPDLAVNDISKIQLRTAADTVTLEKKDAVWRVAERSDYPADFERIRQFIQTLWGLKAAQEMQVGPSQFGRLKIATPREGPSSGTEIDLKGATDKPIGTLIVGKGTEQGEEHTSGGRFVYNPAVKDQVYLVSESFLNLDPLTPSQWLDKAFIVPDELKEVSQSPWSNNPGWKISRDNQKADWKLDNAQPAEKLDESIVRTLQIFTPNFVDVRPSSTSQDETGLKDPFHVQLITFDGFRYDLFLGKQAPDKGRYLQVKVAADLPPTRTPEAGEKPEDKTKRDEEFAKKQAGLKQRLEKEKQYEQWIYIVPDYNVETLLKRRDEIVAKPSPSPSPASKPTK
jgi:Domain of unknown function (DUF4340)